MKDAKGRELQQNDFVLIPARITSDTEGVSYCDVDLETSYDRKPENRPERLFDVSSAVLLRANPGDKNDIADLQVWSPPA